MPPIKRLSERKKKGITPTSCADDHRDGTGPLHRQQTTIGTLPGDVLLEIFDCVLEEDDWNDVPLSSRVCTEWQTLVHVCRRWRQVVFASPHRLNLRLPCTDDTSVRELLDVWPALPLVVTNNFPSPNMNGIDNIIAALEHNDRVCEVVIIQVQSSLLERFTAVMQEPFPMLTHLELLSNGESVPVLPDSFLGGYAPRLQTLSVTNIPIPTLQKLALSSPDLVDLRLWKISYVSPRAMANCLSALPRLENLTLEFYSPQSRPDRTSQNQPPLTRFILPYLTSLRFHGVSEYLEDFVAQIDVPLLERITVTFFNELLSDILQLHRFISRTERFKVLHDAEVVFGDDEVEVTLAGKTGTDSCNLELAVSCAELGQQLSSLARVCNSFLHSFSTLERFDIRRWQDRPFHFLGDMEDIRWLELLHPFTTVKNLTVSKHVVSHVEQAPEGLPAETETDMIQVLENISIEDPERSGRIQEAIGQFISMRQLSGHLVTEYDLFPVGIN
ncbi:hypothetical protein BC827DRAFT_1265949 [Russula dissimulans]|nr:hypothetical protein BC827DRAFT_1265949 [Russula dissimulans]